MDQDLRSSEAITGLPQGPALEVLLTSSDQHIATWEPLRCAWPAVHPEPHPSSVLYTDTHRHTDMPANPYACVHTHTRMHIYTSKHTYTHARIDTQTCQQTHMYMYTHTYAHTRIHFQTFTYTHASPGTCKHMWTHVNTCHTQMCTACSYAHMYTHAQIELYMSDMNTYMYTSTYVQLQMHMHVCVLHVCMHRYT